MDDAVNVFQRVLFTCTVCPCNYRIDFLEYANNGKRYSNAGVNFISYSNVYTFYFITYASEKYARFKIYNDEKYFIFMREWRDVRKD